MYIFWAGAVAGRHIQPDVVVVMPVISESGRMFTQAGVESATLDFEGRAELEYLSTMLVETENRVARAQTSMAGCDYFHMVFMRFSEGGPWVEYSEHEIIVSESLAWTLFGSLNVVGLPVRIGERIYIISGVAQDIAEAATDGFVWLPRGGLTDNGNILYLRPDSYNLIIAHLSAVDMLTAMNRRPQDYTITDLNAYVDGITLRGQVLFAFSGLIVLFFVGKLTYHLVSHQAKTKIDWVIAAVAVAASAGVAIYMLPHISIDMWVPAFTEGGAAGYIRLIFNAGLLAPRQYLPGNLAVLYDLNLRANVAFVVGLVGLIGCVSVKTS